MNQIENLSPDQFLPEMQSRAEKLLAVIIEKRKSLANAPVGRLRVAMHGKQWHCYHVSPSSDSNGVYIPKDKIRFIKRLAQKDYDGALLKELERQLSLIEKFMKEYAKCDALKVFERLHKNRRQFVLPVQFSDEQYAVRWLALPYKGKSFREGEPEFLTSKGERVRSKSEMIIADILAKYNVPYKYERPLQMKAAVGKLIPVYPDFTCLNFRTRQEFLWEHLGRMDDSDYSMKTVMKLRTYSKNGFIPGKNLILTMECDGIPLDRKEVEALVKTFLR
ncbi:MAG: hypothetical protein MJZ26_01515 [Fibrobacter sp.]|nr:hypothetical protein [Fibrobacter sp.]